jgi:hypothetical protein
MVGTRLVDRSTSLSWKRSGLDGSALKHPETIHHHSARPEAGEVVARCPWSMAGRKYYTSWANLMFGRLLGTAVCKGHKSTQLTTRCCIPGEIKHRAGDSISGWSARHLLSFKTEIRLASSPDIDQQLETAGIEVMDYDAKWGRYRLRLTKNDIKKHSEDFTAVITDCRSLGAFPAYLTTSNLNCRMPGSFPQSEADSAHVRHHIQPRIRRHNE